MKMKRQAEGCLTGLSPFVRVGVLGFRGPCPCPLRGHTYLLNVMSCKWAPLVTVATRKEPSVERHRQTDPRLPEGPPLLT